MYMHAKLASDIVNLAQKSIHNVYLKKGPVVVDAKSILGVMTLFDIEDVEIICEDPDVVKMLKELINEL